MNRKDVIENLKNRLNDLHNGYQTYLEHGGKQDIETESDIEALNMAIEALQEPERKWIPVSERLPENGCGVLVTVNGKHNNITFVNALEIAEYGNTEGWIIEGYLDWLDPNVIAWQPLPEPYKGEKD